MKRNASWAFAGNTVYAGSQWIVFVLLARSIGLVEVGVFAYAMAVAGPIFVLANLRLRTLLATGNRSPRDFSDYLTARLITTGVAVVGSLAIGAMAKAGSLSPAVLMLIVGARACEAVSDICHGLFQRELDIRSQAIGLMVNGVLSVALVLASLALSRSLVLATAGYAVGSFLALIAWDLPRRSRLIEHPPPESPEARHRSSWSPAARLIVMALPLGLSSAIGSVQSNLPRYVIVNHLGPAALAIFAAISYIPMVGHLIVNAASQAALPLLATEAKHSPLRYRERLGRLVAGSIALGALGLIAVLVFGRSALALIYGPEYGDHVRLLLILAGAAIATFASVFLGTGIAARLRFRAQPIISTISLAVVAVTIGPLVERYGLNGAAGSLLVGSLVELSAYLAFTIRDLRAAQPPVGVVAGALPGGARP
ncbi:MAG TPA: lipopolysaccharide biosynthesis protein [Vicinamibacterales bacterium]|nr:lipopolysaccharide biosynthesis protein [Vicinamibacterales bacterium]